MVRMFAAIFLIQGILLQDVTSQETIDFSLYHNAECKCTVTSCKNESFLQDLPLEDMIEIVQGMKNIQNNLCETINTENPMDRKIQKLETTAEKLQTAIQQITYKQQKHFDHLMKIENHVEYLESDQSTMLSDMATKTFSAEQIANRTKENAKRMNVLAYHSAMVQNEMKELEKDVDRHMNMTKEQHKDVELLGKDIHSRMKELNNRLQHLSAKQTQIKVEMDHFKNQQLQFLVNTVENLSKQVQKLLSEQEMTAKIRAKQQKFHHEQMLKMADNSCSKWPVTIPPYVKNANMETMTTVFNNEICEYTEYKCDVGFVLGEGHRYMYCKNKQWIGDLPVCTSVTL